MFVYVFIYVLHQRTSCGSSHQRTSSTSSHQTTPSGCPPCVSLRRGDALAMFCDVLFGAKTLKMFFGGKTLM